MPMPEADRGREPEIGDTVITGDVTKGYVEAVITRLAYSGRWPKEVSYVRVRYKTWLGGFKEKWISAFSLSYTNKERQEKELNV